MIGVQSVRWSPDGDAVRIVDQRLLPGEFRELDLRETGDFVNAIRTLAVRGAPAIGIAAAMGVALAAQRLGASATPDFRRELDAAAAALIAARPTAVNLEWAVRSTLAAAEGVPGSDSAALALALRSHADSLLRQDIDMCQRIGENGAALLRDGMNILTHCNTGALATGGIGTALAAVYVAMERGVRLHVWASETRPLLQGSRLTAWELSRAGIPVTVVAEGSVASLMRDGRVDCVLLGADRIARNGDVANKIGTYSHAVLAHAHGVPFYVAAPMSTVDPGTESGEGITIEERAPEEVLAAAGYGAGGVDAYNPAFDVTPARLISAIVTDKGTVCPPYHFP